MPKKTAEKETVKKDKQINNQIKRKGKHFELENEASQVGFKILTRPSTDFPVVYGDKKSIEEIMADNYDEINEPFKLKHNMYLLQPLQNQMNYQRIWIITHLLQTIKCFSIQQMLQ